MGTDTSSIAIITGGAGSIGSEIGRRLASRGYRVCVADMNGDRARATASALGPEHSWFAGDLGDEPTVEGLVAQVSAQGPIGAVVNAAGISPKHADGKLEVGEISADDFRKVLEVNTIAPFLLAKHARHHMPHDGTAAIVNILSIAVRMASGGVRGAVFPPFISSAAHYGASKAALHNLQVSLCRELAPERIRVNGVAPGFIATEMNANIPAFERQSVLDQIPMGRAGRPEDVADVVEFLVGPGSSYMTGAVIDVNGGWLPA